MYLKYVTAVEFFSPLFCVVCFPVTRLLVDQGHIPSTLGRLVNLTQLDLAYNHLSGSIPSEVRLIFFSRSLTAILQYFVFGLNEKEP